MPVAWTGSNKNILLNLCFAYKVRVYLQVLKEILVELKTESDSARESEGARNEIGNVDVRCPAKQNISNKKLLLSELR
jgi:hypothetical protein